MSAWHREHPELVGTDADPWMANPLHAAAFHELELRHRAEVSARKLGFVSLDAAIQHAERTAPTHYCDDCSEYQRGTASGRCHYCGGELVEREP